MNSPQNPANNRILPDSLIELEQFVKDAVGHVSAGKSEERAATYSRVSSIDPHARTYSMEYQPDRAEEYVRSKGWCIVASYADPDRTGRNSKRPGLQAMIRDIESGKISVVVVHRLDRLYRNLESLLRFLRFLKRYRVRLVSVTEQIDTDSWWGRLVLYVLGALAEMYVWQTSVRVREIKAELARKGLHNGMIPIGYCNGLCSTCSDLNGPGYCSCVGQPDRPESSRGRIPVPHPVDQHTVLLIHTLYSQGMSYQDVANYLNTYRFQLPDGNEVRFRTKGVANKRPDRPFQRDSIREIIQNPFYVGLIARRPNPPLDMDDDRVPDILARSSSRKPKKLEDGLTRRTITEMHTGRHQGIIPLSLWQANQQARKSRGTTPFTEGRSVHEYMLSGIAYCWECHSYDGRQASLRGITGNRYQYYRCATMISEYKSRRKPQPEILNEALNALRMNAEEELSRLGLCERHRSTLQQRKLEDQVTQMIQRLQIPTDWHELILAYYLSDQGMSEFELGSFNLRQELTRQRELFKRGHITQAEYEQAYLHIDRQLQRLQPSAQPEARNVAHLLKDFGSLWQKMTLMERRAVLHSMFTGLYFDSDHQLRKVSAQSPFDRLLGLVQENSLAANITSGLV